MSILIYVMGPSGSGKDSMLEYARNNLGTRFPVVFAHRYITRPPEAGGENHISLTTEEFELRKKYELFALDWESHGNFYGIGKEIDIWLEQGLCVVMNGSRGYASTAQARYPSMLPVHVRVDREVLQKRLENRGREEGADLRRRLNRAEQLREVSLPRMVTIQNNGSLEQSGKELLHHIQINCQPR